MINNNELKRRTGILAISMPSLIILGVIITGLIGMAALIGLGWAILVAFAILPVVFARCLVEEQRIMAMQQLIKSLPSRR